MRLLYASPQARVYTNNHYSSYFSLSRGTRQGCPLSPLLFVLVIEPLAIKLRTSACLQGIERDGTKHYVSLYADDLLLYITDPVNCSHRIIQTLDDFGTFSGYKINLQKTVCFPINDLSKQLKQGQTPFHLTLSSFRYLGIDIAHSFKDLHKLNFDKLLTKVKADLQKWTKLPLSLVGRVQTIKMNILPRFLFLFQCLPLFLIKTFFQLLDKVILPFLWAGNFILPNFIFYYRAANIHKILCWRYEEELDWCKMESTSCQTTTLVALTCSHLPIPARNYTSNPVVLSTLKIWAQFRKHFKLNDLVLYGPLCNNHNFLPSSLETQGH